MRFLIPILSLFLFLQPALSQSKANRPNIIFILSDDQRFDHMGCAGHPILKTPTMDRLAKNGVRFRNAFVTTSICAASRASVLTGMFERTHKFTFGTPPVSESHSRTTYAALLRQAGYRTGFVGKFGIGVAAGMQKEMFDYFVPLSRSPYFKKLAHGQRRHVSEIAGDKAIEFLQNCKKGQPFCLSVSFNAPHAEDGDKKNHYPWPKAVDGMYNDAKIPPPKLGDPKIFESQPDVLKNSMNRDRFFWRWDTKEKYEKNVRGYWRMITGIDRVIGRILTELEQLGFDQNTVVIFHSDNGYYLANRGFAGKWSHYEDSLRIPMIIYDPRLPSSLRGRVVDQMALNIDTAATIVDLAHLKVPNVYQGESLVPILQGKKTPDWRSDFFCEHLMRHPRIPKWEGVRDKRWVYARYFEQKPVVEFLHDLKTDPDQLQNFAKNPKYAKQLQTMRNRCDELRDAYGGPYSSERFPGRKKKPKKK